MLSEVKRGLRPDFIYEVFQACTKKNIKTDHLHKHFNSRPPIPGQFL